MKTSLLIIGLGFVLSAGADTVTDPLQAFVKLCDLSSGRVVYRWDVDLNNDGRQEVLLASKPTAQEQNDDLKENNGNPQTVDELGFFVYIPNPNGSGYIQSKGTDFGTYVQPETALSVDITRCYVGEITQLNRWGIVTVDLQPAGRKSKASAAVIAYTLEGNHLKVTTLAQYDPTVTGGNAIYDEYLSDAHRTPMKLQEVTLP